jgi:uncharacterized membrane protein YfcA
MKEPREWSVRELAGFVIAAVGVALVPIGWYSSRLLWIASLVLLIIGLLMLFTERVAAREKEIESQSVQYSPPVKQSVPGDVHNYSGWRDGGQSLGGDHGSSDGD